MILSPLPAPTAESSEADPKLTHRVVHHSFTCLLHLSPSLVSFTCLLHLATHKGTRTHFVPGILLHYIAFAPIAFPTLPLLPFLPALVSFPFPLPSNTFINESFQHPPRSIRSHTFTFCLDLPPPLRVFDPLSCSVRRTILACVLSRNLYLSLVCWSLCPCSSPALAPLL